MEYQIDLHVFSKMGWNEYDPLALAIAERLERIAELMEKESGRRDQEAVRAEQEENHRLWLEDRQDDLRHR